MMFTTLAVKVPSHQHMFQLHLSAPSVPFVSIFISVWAVVETVIGIWEVGSVIQCQNTVLAYFEVLRELNSYLLSGFVLQYSHILGLPITQLQERKLSIN